MDLSTLRTLFPLADERGHALFQRISEHPFAPPFTHRIGDHVVEEDIEAVQMLRKNWASSDPIAFDGPSDAILEWVKSRYDRVPLWRERIPSGFQWAARWHELPTMNREDLVTRMADVVPEDEPLDRLIVYDTSGTTGHALRIPHHPRAVAQTHILAERALAWFGLNIPQGPDGVACMNLHAQASIWSYVSLFSVWGQAGFARLNLSRHAWPGGPDHAQRFFTDLAPSFLCGNPQSFSELLHWRIEARPQVLLSTAVALSAPLQMALAQRYHCPVLDWYSTSETGPIACSYPGGEGLALLAPDVYLELLDFKGHPVALGQRGEITVTGGRNPYLPLLRYRTGDYARFSASETEGVRRLFDLEGRESMLFRSATGEPVNPVDIGRALRQNFAVVQHAFVQRADGSCLVRLRPAYGMPIDIPQVKAALWTLMGTGTQVEVRIERDSPSEVKWIPYRQEGFGQSHD